MGTGVAADERRQYDELRDDALGEQVRLEQERIRYSWLRRALRNELAEELPHSASSMRGVNPG